jgi:hypothetical protein
MTLLIKAMLLEPLALWNPDPFTVIWVPTTPLEGAMLVTWGGGTV